MGRGGLTPPPLQAAQGCGGHWCWSVCCSYWPSQRDERKSPQRERSPERSLQSQGSRANVTLAPQSWPQETPRSTRTTENALAGGTSPGTTVLAARRESAPCSAGSQCTSSATRSLTWAALECATTSTPSQEKATHASLTTPTRIVPGATRRAGNASRTPSPDQTQRREAVAKQGLTRSTARPSKAIASTSATATPNATCKKKANVGKFGQYWQCECDKGWTGNGIQCMDSNGTLSAMPGQQVEVTLTMTAGLYNDAPVENEFNHGAAMESLLSEMETAGDSCSGDDCEASYEVTEL